MILLFPKTFCETLGFFVQVNVGLECGIGVDDFNEWEEGDYIETFNSIQKRRTLEEASTTMTAAFKEAGIEI